MRLWDLKVKFEPRDLWVGAFWNREAKQFQDRDITKTSLTVCPLPCLAITVSTYG